MLIYTVAARSSDGAVLVEASAAGMEGNYPMVTQELIKAIRARPDLISVGNRRTFNHRVSSTNATTDNTEDVDPLESLWKGLDEMFGYENEPTNKPAVENNPTASLLNHYFHLVHGEGVYYVCLSDDTEMRQHAVNFGFLHEFMNKFTNKFGPNKIKRANAYGMEKPFATKLSSIMHHFNTNRNELQHDRVMSKLTSEIDSLKSLMGENITLLLKRGDYLEDMIVQSESLVEESKVFEKRSINLKREMRNRYYFYKMVVAGFCIILLYFMVATVCGFGFSKCSSGGDEDE